MADYLGIRAASSTVRFSFTTHAASGAAVAPSSAFEAADLKVYKDGTATPRSSANGITMTSPFNSITGLHHVDIDLSDNTDAGFYAAGSIYSIVLSPDTETVDGLTVVKVLAVFDIGVPVANVAQWNGTNVSSPATAGIPDVNVKNIDNDAASASGTVTFPGTLASTTNITAATGVDVTKLNGVAQSLVDLKDFADDGYDPSTNKVQGVVLTDTVTTYTSNTPQTGDAYAVVNSGTFGNAAIKTALDALVTTVGVAGAGLTATATAVWSVATRILTAGTNIVLAKGTGVTGFNDISATDVWAAGTRTLTSFGTLVADVATAVWGAVTRSLTDKTDFALTAAYDPAKTAAQAGDAMTLTAAYDAAKTAASQTSVDGLPTAADTADAVWEEAIADHDGTPGSTAEALESAAAGGSVPTADQNADALLDRVNGIETGLTPRNSLRLIAAASAGKLTGAATTTVTIRNAEADSKNRIVATVDSNGNRTAITTDLS